MDFQPYKGKPLVLFITDFQGIIPQRITHWEGYDLYAISKHLESYGIASVTIGAHQLDLSNLPKWTPVSVFYASSQQPLYKQYLFNILYQLHHNNLSLIPSLPHLLAHEDKSFQTMFLQQTKIRFPRSHAFGHIDDALRFLQHANYPLVGKSIGGFGSRGVSLIQNAAQGRRFARKHMFHRHLENNRPLAIRVWQRIFKPKPNLGLFLFQELVPNLEGDWKILIWNDVACGIFRNNRKNDFRASGSGSIKFCEIPRQVLDFAYFCLQELRLSWASFDIAHNGNECFLLEYQAVHFGLTTAEKGQFYYRRSSDGEWKKNTGRIDIENEIALSIKKQMAATK